MSDRIDELVADAAFFNDNGCDKCSIVTELATIAREAEARALKAEATCEWLAGKVSDRDALAATRDGGTFRSPDEWLAAAREAVKWSGLEQS